MDDRGRPPVPNSSSTQVFSTCFKLCSPTQRVTAHPLWLPTSRVEDETLAKVDSAPSPATTPTRNKRAAPGDDENSPPRQRHCTDSPPFEPRSGDADLVGLNRLAFQHAVRLLGDPDQKVALLQSLRRRTSAHGYPRPRSSKGSAAVVDLLLRQNPAERTSSSTLRRASTYFIAHPSPATPSTQSKHQADE